MSAAERYAKAMYEAEYDGETDTWPPPHPSDREWWMHLGEVAAGVGVPSWALGSSGD
jgi:hypothetical protein